MTIIQRKKPKIGLITFVRSNNWGTFLQAYATVKLLEKYLGDYYDIELVDITNRRKNVNNKNSNIKVFSLGSYVKRIKTSRKLKRNRNNIIRFYESNMNLSERFNAYNFNDALEFISNKNYDVLISGSDEIWANKAGIDIPNIYYIPNEIKAKKISLATSANRGDLSNLTENQKKFIINSLNDYNFISVRDMNTYNFVAKLTANITSLTFDPTLGWDFSPVSHQKVRKNKKVIAIMFGKVDNVVAEKIIKRYGKDYKIVSIHSYLPGTKWLNIKDPLEFVSLYDEYDLMITSSYHGTIFSIKSNTPFISIDNESIYKKYDSKILDLLRRLNLEYHYQHIFDNNEKDYDLLFTKIDSLLNYEVDIDFNDARTFASDIVNNTLSEVKRVLL